MRLFAKFFLCAVIVISIALLLSGYLLITFSHESALNRESERAVNQFQYDKFAVQAHLISNADSFADNFIQGTAYHLLSRLSFELNGLTAFFAEDRTLVYSELPAQTDFSLIERTGLDYHIIQFQAVGEENYILVCGKLTQSGVTLYLVIATNISSIVAHKEQMMQSFAKVYSVTLILSTAIILALSAFITNPLKKLNTAANRIAQGSYNERLSISSGDEIGELSDSFNLMADAVEEKVFELLENARQKEDFVANFAHELKTPLTSVIGYADMLYQKILPPEQIKEAAWYILNEGLRLEALSLKLMDLIVLNRQDFILEEMHTNELLSDIAGGLKPVLEEKKVILHLDVHPAYIMAEYDLFKTLILNLIDNAFKAACGRIDITGRHNEKQNRYTISVADNGRGMQTHELARITEAFYTVDKSRSRKQHGAGLGLALAERIAEVHGSSLEFNSGEGVGTVVKIELSVKSIKSVKEAQADE
jgi:signal transduction histidine kinase